MQKIVFNWQGIRTQKYIHKYSEIINDLYFSIYTSFYKNEEFKNDIIKKEFNEAMLSNVKDLSMYFGL